MARESIPAKVRKRLTKLFPQGGAWQKESDEEIIQHIFDWGFSTRESLSDTSGRGVGLEAVTKEVQKLGGKISVSSKLNKGTEFEIIVPYRMDLSTLIEGGAPKLIG